MKYIITDQKKNGYLTGLFFKKDKCYRIYGVESHDEFEEGIIFDSPEEIIGFLSKKRLQKTKNVL